MTECPRCSKLIAADPQGHTPPWCPICGTDLRGRSDKPATPAKPPDLPPDAPPPEIAAVAPAAQSKPDEVPPEDLVPPTVDHSNLRIVMLGVAALCGLLCSFIVYLGLQEPKLKPGEVIVRDSCQIQVPSTGDWKITEEGEPKEGAEIALLGPAKCRILVHMIRPGAETATLGNLVEQTRKEWSARGSGCRFLPSTGERLSVAGRPALRVVALGQMLDADGDQPRREAVVLIDGGVGYRLTCAGPQRRFDTVRPAFEEFINHFVPGPRSKEP